MAFDITSARKAGYSDAEIADFLTKTPGAVDFNVKGALEHYSPTEVLDHLAPPESFGQKLKNFASKVLEDPPPTIAGLKSLPQRASENANTLAAGEDFSPGPGLEAAGLASGLASIRGLPKSPIAAKAQTLTNDAKQTAAGISQTTGTPPS